MVSILWVCYCLTLSLGTVLDVLPSDVQASGVRAPDPPPVGDHQPGGGSAGGAGLDLHCQQTRDWLHWRSDTGQSVKYYVLFSFITFVVLLLRLSNDHGDRASQTRRQIWNDCLKKKREHCLSALTWTVIILHIFFVSSALFATNCECVVDIFCTFQL